MAEEIIKKARIIERNLPPILSEIDGYLLRYRIRSSDQNRASHWSPFIVVKPEFTFVPESINSSTSNSILSVSWDSVAILKSYASYPDIIQKVLSSNVATITTSSAHYMNVGDYVTVSGVDSVFNGTHVITNVTTTPTHSFSFYKNNANISLTAVSPNGTYTKNYYIRKALEYDIWVRWDRNDGGDWIYKERIEGTSLSLPYPEFYNKNQVLQSSSPNRVSIEVYLKGQPPKRGDGIPGNSGTSYLKVYQILNRTI